MDQVREMLHANEIHSRGITGKGVTAVILDTGMCDHPDYADRILVFRDFVNGRTRCYDDASHGSHVSGILGGDGKVWNGRYRGIAPECSLIHLKVLDRNGQGQLNHMMQAIKWVMIHREEYNIRIMNLSAGTGKNEKDEKARKLVELVEAAWDVGITVVVAAGNLGPGPGSITVPGNSKKVITVGALETGMHANRRRGRVYSGCGPTLECVQKPEVVAPGTDIISCSPLWKKGTFYAAKSGTSMAAPAIAGGIALLFQKEPGLTNVEVKMRLKQSAVKTGCEKRYGWGIPDLRKLLYPDRMI